MENIPYRTRDIICAEFKIHFLTQEQKRALRQRAEPLDDTWSLTEQLAKESYDNSKKDRENYPNWLLALPGMYPPGNARVKSPNQVWTSIKTAYERTATKIAQRALPTFLALNAALGYSSTNYDKPTNRDISITETPEW